MTDLDLVQIERKDLADFRKRHHIKQNCICPLLGVEVNHDKTAVDHKHKLKGAPAGPNGDGLIRGVTQIQANAMEGKITNSWKRLGLGKFTDLPSFLRNLANYLENPPIVQRFIHPDEKTKRERVKKSQFNRVVKYYFQMRPKARKLPVWPKSGKLYLNDDWKYLISKSDLLHEKKHPNKRASSIEKIDSELNKAAEAYIEKKKMIRRR